MVVAFGFGLDVVCAAVVIFGGFVFATDCADAPTGADDYVTKPFNMKELVSRINVFLRRSKMLFPQLLEEYTIDTMKFIPHQQLLFLNGEEILLTQKEARLLEFFCGHPDKVLHRKDILTYVWGKNDYFIGRSMDVFITRLRKILKPATGISIETIPQTGYRFNTVK